ncbi:C39 family peptidase [Fibrella forsythiae]|uniref:C39 family peptidase n=1 Tax=Fibrella forsythiae TaxID=2817061 RepID=A0ABS3JJW2_9BACT|nr:C39 family peptidase [Fibrella forsythiae]MBO0950289.1 C39 family peptidase [Fibrella forsythiae]
MKKQYLFCVLFCLWGVWATAQATFWTPTSLSLRVANCRVPLIPQKASLLCWAASMQMITRYHGQERTQCQLRVEASTYWQTQNSAAATPPANFTPVCESLVCAPDEFDQLQIGTTGNWNNDLYQPSQFLPIFAQIGFASAETYTPLSWTALKGEIDHCRPLISIISEGNSIDRNTHAVVTTGYVQLTGFVKGLPVRWLLINDPLGPANCEAETYLLNHPTSLTTNIGVNTDQVIYAESFIYGIQPQDLTAGLTCGPKRKYTLYWARMRQTPLLAGLLRLNKLPAVKVSRLIRNHYVSVQKLRDSTVSLVLDSLRGAQPVFDWVDTRGSRPLAYTFQRTRNQSPAVIKLSESHYKKRFACSLGPKRILLTYRPNVAGTKRYEYVRIRALGQSYYRFSHRKRWYLVPSIRYTFRDGRDDQSLLPNVAYAETTVLSRLRIALN